MGEVHACPHSGQYTRPPLSRSGHAVPLQLICSLDKVSVSATGSRHSLTTSYVIGVGGGESGKKPQYVTPNVLFDTNIYELKSVMKQQRQEVGSLEATRKLVASV